MKNRMAPKVFSILFLAFFLYASASSADSQIRLSAGQTVYVPIYSNVFSGPKARPFNLAAILSIRNTNLNNSIIVGSIEYYDNDGHLLKKYIEEPLYLSPLASKHFFIEERDESGGFGANFIVRWKATKEINAPLIESIMIGTRSGQGISFVSKGQVIAEKTE